MQKEDYLDLYDQWKSKAIKSGFRFKQFQYHVNRLLTEEGRKCPESIALAAKMAYRSLEEERQVELQLQSAMWIS